MSSRYRYRRNFNNYSRRIGASRRRPFSSGSSSLVKRARGNMRAANNQNDVSNVVINLMHTVYAGTSAYFENHDAEDEAFAHDYPDADTLHHIGTCAVNIYDLLMKSDFFSSYSGMYDQFRINSIKVKVTPVQWSVFDQSRSTSNLIARGSKYNPSTEAVQSIRIPSANDYVVNPDFNPDEEEDSMNPRFIVPGIDVREYNENDPSGLDPQNPPVRLIHKYSYVPIPQPKNTPFLNAFPDDIKYIANIRAGAGNLGNGGDGTFVDGIITALTQSKSNQIPIETFEKESYQYPQALTVVTAWDRTGLNEAQLDLIENGEIFWPVNDSTGEASRVDVDDVLNNERYVVCTIGDDISSYSSASTKQLVGGASFNLTRYLYPSSQQEKSTYYSTSSLIDQQNKNDIGGTHYLYRLVENGWNKDTLTNLYESAVVPFKPTFLLGILGHNEVSADNFEYTNTANERIKDIKTFQMIKPVKFNLEFDIGVTFRGLRKVQVV